VHSLRYGAYHLMAAFASGAGSLHRAAVVSAFLTSVACSGPMNVPMHHSASLFTDSTVAEWTVSSHPELVIGGSDERDGFAIGRFGGAVLLEDRVVVADAAFGEIRFYATDGELVNRVGRPGSGPYEFRAIRAIAPHGDSAVVVWDVGLSRLTKLGRNGERRGILLPDLSRAVSIAPSFIGVVRGGHFVFRDGGSVASFRDEPRGERSDSVRYLTLDPAGSWVAEWSGSGPEVHLGRSDNYWGTLPVIFGRSGTEAIAGSHLVLENNDSLALRKVDLHGAVEQTFAANVTSTQVKQE
jgi:hypothetical protein